MSSIIAQSNMTNTRKELKTSTNVEVHQNTFVKVSYRLFPLLLRFLWTLERRSSSRRSHFRAREQASQDHGFKTVERRWNKLWDLWGKWKRTEKRYSNFKSRMLFLPSALSHSPCWSKASMLHPVPAVALATGRESSLVMHVMLTSNTVLETFQGGKRTMKWRPFPAPQAAYWWHSFGASTFLACSAKKNGQVEIRLASPLSMSLLILFGPLVCQCFAMFQLLNFDLLNLFTACWDDWTGQNALVFKPDTAKDCLRIRLLHYQSLETHSLAGGTDRGSFFPEQSLSQRFRIS